MATQADVKIVGDYERWSEQQAVQCERHMERIKAEIDKLVERLAENHRQTRPGMDYLHLVTNPLHEQALRLNFYAQQADSFRRGRWAREESEAYQKAYGGA